jgi:hypothetical protein
MQTTKSGADRVESLPFTFKDDRTEMGGALDHMRKNGPGVLQHVEGMIIIDPGKPLMVPQSAPCDMYFDNALEWKTVQAIQRAIALQTLVDRQMGTVQEKPRIGILNDPGKILQQRHIPEKDLTRWIFREHFIARGLAEVCDPTSLSSGRLVSQDRGQQEHVAPFPPTKVPQPGITAEPDWLELGSYRPYLRNPVRLKIFRFIQVQVQKMVGRGEALLGPFTGNVIQASAHLDTDLQKRHIGWMLSVYAQGIQGPMTVDSPIFCGDPKSKIGH